MLDYKVNNGILYIYLEGELDHFNAKNLREELDFLIKKEDYPRIIFDMSRLHFMDSTGIGLIIGRYREARVDNKVICIKSPSPIIDKVLKVSGIYDVIPKIV